MTSIPWDPCHEIPGVGSLAPSWQGRGTALPIHIRNYKRGKEVYQSARAAITKYHRLTKQQEIFLIFSYLFHCCARAFSTCIKQGLLFAAGFSLPCSFCCCRTQGLGVWAQWLRPPGSRMQVHSRGAQAQLFSACGIFPDQESNLCVPCTDRWILSTGPPGSPKQKFFMSQLWKLEVQDEGVRWFGFF